MVRISHQDRIITTSPPMALDLPLKRRPLLANNNKMTMQSFQLLSKLLEARLPIKCSTCKNCFSHIFLVYSEMVLILIFTQIFVSADIFQGHFLIYISAE
jgi:hypothetical protein